VNKEEKMEVETLTKSKYDLKTKKILNQNILSPVRPPRAPLQSID